MSALKYIFHSLLCLVGLQRIAFLFCFVLLQAVCANARVQSVSTFCELVAAVESRAETEKGPLPLGEGDCAYSVWSWQVLCVLFMAGKLSRATHVCPVCCCDTNWSISLLSLLKSNPGCL